MNRIVTTSNEAARSGSTTTAIALAVYFSLYAKKNTLFINYALDNKAEYYLGGVERNTGLDYVGAFDNPDIKKIERYSASINDKLTVLSGFSNNNAVKNTDGIFAKELLNAASRGFDYTIVDLSNNTDVKGIFDIADLSLKILPVDIYLKNGCVKNSSKEICAVSFFNGVSESLIKKYVDDEVNIIRQSPDIFYEANIEHTLYEYLADNIRGKDPFIMDMLALVEYITEYFNEQPQPVVKKLLVLLKKLGFGTKGW